MNLVAAKNRVVTTWRDLPIWGRVAAIGGLALLGAGVLFGGPRAVTFLKQGDPEWRGNSLGFSNGTIGVSGCFLTSLTMAANALTGASWNPADANEIMTAAGPGFAFTGILIILENAASLLGMRMGQRVSGSAAAMAAAVDQALAHKGLAILKVTHGRGDTHFVLIHGKTAMGYAGADPAFGHDTFIDPATMNGVASSGTIYVGDTVDQLFKA